MKTNLQKIEVIQEKLKQLKAEKNEIEQNPKASFVRLLPCYYVQDLSQITRSLTSKYEP